MLDVDNVGSFSLDKNDNCENKGSNTTISEKDLKQLRGVIEWKTNQILCDCGWGANIFALMSKIDRSTWKKKN